MPAPVVPRRIDRYEIHALVSDGGLGRLYRAVDLPTGEPVALKVLAKAKAQDRVVVGRFLREAGAMRSLDHPGIARVLDIGRAEDTHWIAMEWVSGKDLLQVVTEDGPLPWDRLLAIAEQLALALVYAHAKGVVHRDLKPANAVLRPDGSVVLVDFGFAKRLDQPVEALTQTGSGMGTPHYISPEQVANAKHVDLRTDIYSLAATLHHLATGAPPFEGRTTGDVIHRMMTEPLVPIAARRAGAPRGLSELLARMLARSPDERPQSMRDVAAELARIRAECR